MAALIASALLTLLLAVYIFYPEKKVTAQTEKPRLEFLEERKAMLYDNLRDLSFEHRAGKYREDEFAAERLAIETEAATVVAEIELLTEQERTGPEGDGQRRPGATVKA